jgi:hypothetical protein
LLRRFSSGEDLFIPTMKALSLACFIAVVFCGRLCIVFFAGSPIPFHDQWYAEAQGILMPYLHHQLVVGHFFAPNGDHVIALTRAVALLLEHFK